MKEMLWELFSNHKPPYSPLWIPSHSLIFPRLQTSYVALSFGLYFPVKLQNTMSSPVPSSHTQDLQDLHGNHIPAPRSSSSDQLPSYPLSPDSSRSGPHRTEIHSDHYGVCPGPKMIQQHRMIPQSGTLWSFFRFPFLEATRTKEEVSGLELYIGVTNMINIVRSTTRPVDSVIRWFGGFIDTSVDTSVEGPFVGWFLWGSLPCFDQCSVRLPRLP